MPRNLTIVSLIVLALPVMAQMPPAAIPPQMQQPPLRPTISPYLNLLRNNVPAYQNYYGLVQPQMQAQAAINNLQNQVLGLQNFTASVYGGTGNELYTGKQVGYFTHRQWFMNRAGFNTFAGTTGQYSTLGNNPVYNAPQQSPISPNSVMPYRR